MGLRWHYRASLEQSSAETALATCGRPYRSDYSAVEHLGPKILDKLLGYLCGISMRGARTPALASTGTSGNPSLLDGRATHGSAGEAPGNGATVLHRLFLCFSFF